jgi:uncharacterized protein with HEPN domain
MPLDDRSRSCFLDIINCISDIRAFTDGISYHVFAMEKMRKLAVERLLEVIGQAANGIPKEIQALYPKLPWARMIGLRNKLAHDYGEILVNRIWEISRNAIPELEHELKQIPELHDLFQQE